MLVVLILIHYWERYLRLKFRCTNLFQSIRSVHEFLDDFIVIFVIYVLRPFHPYIICAFSLQFERNRILDSRTQEHADELQNSGKQACSIRFAAWRFQKPVSLQIPPIAWWHRINEYYVVFGLASEITKLPFASIN